MSSLPQTDRRDLVILGGGLVGMTLALAAARAGLSSHVVDRADPAELTAEGADGRASAISTASWNLFRNIGLADRLAPLGCPIDAIAVSDGMKPGRLDFRPEPHEGSLGYMFANRDLRLALFEAARAEPLVAWHSSADVTRRERGPHGVSVTLAGGQDLTGNLLVGVEHRINGFRQFFRVRVLHRQHGILRCLPVPAQLEQPVAGVAALACRAVFDSHRRIPGPPWPEEENPHGNAGSVFLWQGRRGFARRKGALV